MGVPRLVLGLALLVGARPTAAQTTYTSAATGTWSNSASWSPTGVPVAGDTPTVAGGHTITVDGTQAVASLTVSAGAILISASTGSNALTIGGNLANDGTITATQGSGTLLFTFNAASGTQTIGGTASTTFYNLTLSNAATRQFGNDTVSRTFTVSNTLTWSDGSISVGQASVADKLYLSSTTLNSPLSVPTGRSLTTVGTSAFHLRGSSATNGISLSSGATLSPADATASVACGGNFDINSGSTYTGTAGTTTFNGTTTISGSSTNINFGNLTIASSGAVSTSATGTTRIIRVAGNFSNAGSYTHTLVTDRTTDGSTLVFDGTTTLSGAGTFTFVSVKVNTAKTLTGSSGSINVAGDWTNNGTFTHNSGTVTLNGSGSQTLGGTTATTTFYDLTVNNSTADDFNNPVTMPANVTVTRALTVTDGRLKIANGKTLTVGADASANGHSVAAGAILDIQHSVAGTATLKVEKGDTLTVSGLIEVSWEPGGVTVAFDVALPGTGTEATIRIASGSELTLVDFQAIGAGKFEIMTGARLVEFTESTSCAWSLDLDNTTSTNRAQIPYSLSGVTFNGTTSVIAGWYTPSVWMFGGSGAAGETDPGGRIHWLTGAFGKVDGTISSSGAAVTGSGTNFLNPDDAGKSIRVGAETRTISSVQSGTGLTLSSAFSSNLSAGTKYAILYDTLPLAVTLNSGASTTIRMSPAVPMNYNFDVNDWAGGNSYTLENFVFAPVQPSTWTRLALMDGDTGTAARCTLRNCIVARGGLDEMAADNCTIYPLSGSTAITFTNRGTVRNTIELGATTPADANKNILVSDTDAATYFLDRATLDFHLKSGAANAIDTGQSLTPASDFEGQTRPNGSAWDVGADEYYAVGGGGINKLSIGSGPVTKLYYLGTPRGTGTSTNGYAYGVSGDTITVLDLDNLTSVASITAVGPIVSFHYWVDDWTQPAWLARIWVVVDTDLDGKGNAIQSYVDRGGDSDAKTGTVDDGAATTTITAGVAGTFTQSDDGAYIVANAQERRITAYTSSTVVTVASAFSPELAGHSFSIKYQLIHPADTVASATPYWKRRFGDSVSGSSYLYKPRDAGGYPTIMNVILTKVTSDGEASSDNVSDATPGVNECKWLRMFLVVEKTSYTNSTGTGGTVFKINANHFDWTDDVPGAGDDNQAFGKTMWAMLPTIKDISPVDSVDDDITNGVTTGWRNFEYRGSATFTWGETSPRLFIPCSNTTGTTQQAIVRLNRNTLTATGAVDTYWQTLEEGTTADECWDSTIDNGGDNGNVTYCLRDGYVVYNRKRGAANAAAGIRWASNISSYPTTPARRTWGMNFAVVGGDGALFKIFDNIGSDTDSRNGYNFATGKKVVADDAPPVTESAVDANRVDSDWPLPCYGKPVGTIFVRATKIYWITDQGYLYGYNWDRLGNLSGGPQTAGDETPLSGFPIKLGGSARSMYVHPLGKIVVGIDSGDVYQVNP